MTPIIIAVMLGLTGALVVAFPLLGLIREQHAVENSGTLAAVADRERQARQALREVELDYTLGNLEAGDYDALRGRYERRALAALRTRYQREQELDAQIERELDALRGAHPAKPRSAIASASRAATPTDSPTTSAKPTTSRAAPGPRVSRQVTPRDRRARDRKGEA
jgi:hypothetical protein